MVVLLSYETGVLSGECGEAYSGHESFRHATDEQNSPLDNLSFFIYWFKIEAIPPLWLYLSSRPGSKLRSGEESVVVEIKLDRLAIGGFTASHSFKANKTRKLSRPAFSHCASYDRNVAVCLGPLFSICRCHSVPREISRG